MIIRNDNITEASVIDADASSFIDRLRITGITLTNDQSIAMSRFVSSLKSNNVWNSIKALYPLIGTSTNGASSYELNLKSTSFTGDIQGSMTLNSFGIIGDGLTAYMDTGLVTNNEMNFNSQHIMCYTSAASTGLEALMGACDGNGYNGTSMLVDYEGAGYISMNEGVVSNPFTSITGYGMILISRIGNSKSSYLNGTKLQTVSSTPTNYTSMRSMWIMGRNADDGRPFPASNILANNEIRVASIGSGLTDLQAASFYTAVEEFCVSFNKSINV